MKRLRTVRQICQTEKPRRVQRHNRLGLKAISAVIAIATHAG